MQTMINLLKSIIFTIFLITPTLLIAEQLGRYISIEKIEISDTITVPAGAEVNFLGVIDVTLGAVPSGKLATFTYKNQVLNADATLFYAQSSDQSVLLTHRAHLIAAIRPQCVLHLRRRIVVEP